MMRMKKDEKEKESRRRARRPKERQTLGESWEVAYSPSDTGAELAECQCCRGRTTENGSGNKKMQQEIQNTESRWMETAPERLKQQKGEDRTEMEKKARLYGSTWSTAKNMRRHKGKCDVLFGMEHRLRKEEMEEQFNKEAKEGWRFAADAARITDERANSEDRKHASGGVFVAIDSNLGTVVGAEEGGD